jgi:transposase
VSRLFLGSCAVALDHGGIGAVANITKVNRDTVSAGKQELNSAVNDIESIDKTKKKIRRSGGGRKKSTEKDSQLKDALEALLEPTTRGDPESPVRWTCKSVRKLANELCKHGHKVSYMIVSRLLKEMKYSLQGNSKALEGSSHPDRNAQV